MSSTLGARYTQERTTIDWGKDLVTKAALITTSEVWKRNPDSHGAQKFPKLVDSVWGEVSERLFGKPVDLPKHIWDTQQRKLSANKIVQRGDKTNRYPREYPRNNAKTKDLYKVYMEKCGEILDKYTTRKKK